MKLAKKIERFTLGSDPELFLKRKDTGEYYPAIGFVPGNKVNPSKMLGLEGYTWQIDGVAIEYGIPPCENKADWVKAHLTALRYIKANINNEEFDLAIDASAEFNPDYLEMPEARIAGCESDNNAWLKIQNPRVSLDNTNLRAAGGHVHIGFVEGKKMELCEELIRTLDLFLGVPSVLMDKDTQRRQLYGKAGSFRFAKNYVGCEYRSLSNFWIKNIDHMNFVYDGVQKAIDFINEGGKINEEDGEMIQLCINDSEVAFAEELLNTYKISVPQTVFAL